MEEFMARVKIRPEWKRSLPVVALLSTYQHWKVEMSNDPDPVFSFALEPNRLIRREDGSFWGNWLDKREKDAHEVRERFFTIENPEQALAFFRDFGPWRVDELWGKRADPISFSQIKEKLRFYENAIVNKDESDNLSFSAEFREKQQCWLVACKDVLACVRTTVILDRASRWRWCERKDCTAPPFECGNHGRKYHDECAWLQRKRNQRDRAKKKQVGKGRKG
jgi:hypothetical protein